MSFALNGPALGTEETAFDDKPSVQPQIGPDVSRKKIISQPVVRDGRFLRVGKGRFWIRGVTYGTFRPNDQGEPYPPFNVLREDFYKMRVAGINTVRLYTPPSDRIADAAAEAGLFLVPDICWGPRRCELDDADTMEFISEWITGHARRLSGHPAILMYSLGNEIPPLVVRWYGRKRIESFLRWLHDLCREHAPRTLLTYVNHPPTEYLHLPFLDVVSYNIYLEREAEFRAYLERLQTQAGDRPLFLTEVGLDSRQHGEATQAKFLNWQLRAVFEKGLCGAAVYSWTDEWHIFGSAIEGWSFGLTEANRQPKLALSAVREVYHRQHRELRNRLKPLVSVVVCAHNATATIGECLQSLSRLKYPSYEVLVVDDGSTDGTAAAAVACGARLLSIERGGLSRARNEGVKAAKGDIVAFIDADAYPDPDWLYFAVNALEEKNAAAVGGPNLCPPGDGFVAHCVDKAPGNPTHVLINDTSAEHIPGCNMIFRKKALESVGMFDVTHRAAGDDVDVCWKLLARQETIAFSSTAVVWHHRRGTVSGFLRQQRGYGHAEAHLRNRYPGHYNTFGYAVWQGKIYDAAVRAFHGIELPALFRSRIYQGQFGSAQFQSIYQPFQTWWFQIFTTIEWMGLAMASLLSTALACWLSPPAAVVLAVWSAGFCSLTLVSALVAGNFAANSEKWRGWRRWQGLFLVAFLHLAQPLARAYGNLKGWLELRTRRLRYSASSQIYGNLLQRDAWLRRLRQQLQNCGWIATEGDVWDHSDLLVQGPGPVRLRFVSVCEEHLEREQHYVRYKILSRWKPSHLVWLAALVGLFGFCFTQIYLLPLAVPLLLAIIQVARARVCQTAALSQLALECAEPLGMVPVEAMRPC